MRITLTLLLSTIFFVACGNSSSTNDGQNQNRINDVEAQEMKSLIESQPGIILDVRTPGEVSQGFIEGAKNIDITQGNFIEKASEMDKNTPVYVYCKLGGRSANASEQLAKAGYTKVYNMMGGFEAWKAAGYPVAK